MSKEEILKNLKLPGRQIHRDTLSEILHNSDLYREELLQVLNREADNPQNPASRTEHNDWLYAMYILAELREKRAFTPILKLFSRSGKFLNPLTGDIVLQNLGQILASVANGDSSELKKFIENEMYNEYCRGAGIEALVIMLEIGELPREDVYLYFDGLFRKLERTPIFPWTILAQSAILFFRKSFLKEVKHAFQNQFIDEIYLDMEEVEAFLSNPELSQLALAKKKYGIVLDALATMEWWANFQD